MFSKEAQALAKAMVEAIKKIAKRQEKECSRCRGLGKFPLSKARIVAAPRYTHIECPTCKGTGKVKGKWEWEPEVGEWCIDKWLNKPVLIYAIDSQNEYFYLARENATQYNFYTNAKNKLTPLLHWERIISILKAFGFVMTVTIGQSGGQICIYYRQHDEVSASLIYEKMYSGRPQPVVMQAVIALAKKENQIAKTKGS